MKVLLLSPFPELLAPALDMTGDTLITDQSIDVDFVVSFGHQQIIKEPMLSCHKDRIINLHLSFLPFGRGADPNFWAWFDDFPKGVTIHRVDEGINTGNILVQQHVTKWHGDDTLNTSYYYLIATAKQLFEENWKNIRRDGLPTRKAGDHGNCHNSEDKDEWFLQLPLGWDTPVKTVKRIGREHRASFHEKENRSPRVRKYRQQTLPEL